MATTGTSFVYVTGANPVLNGTAVQTPPFLDTYNPKEAMVAAQLDQAVGGSGAATNTTNTIVDRLTFDPGLTAAPPVGTPVPVPEASGPYIIGGAKNGCTLLTLSGTTAQSIDLTNLATGTPTSTAGDTSFATVYALRLKNLGTTALTLSPGSSNPSPVPALGGTTPTLTLPAGSELLLHDAAGWTITGSAKVFTITPSSGGLLAVTVAGA
jgi:hypothetical protein